jgi:RNA polymerase sigma-70 factor (ECF subfamily)
MVEIYISHQLKGTGMEETTHRDAAELARRAARGSGEAFVQLAEGVKMNLYKAAWAMMSNEADALDAVDETIYKAYRSIRRLRQPRYFKTWITRILINTCNRKLQLKKREVPMEYQQEDIHRDDLEGLALRDAVQMLPCILRDVIALRYFSDMTVADTARVLNRPEGTVKSQQRRALALLRVELKEEEV